MNITCEKKELLKALNITINSISERSTVEALKCFKLEAKEDILIITANNLETNIIASVKAKVDSQGKTLVQARTFLSIISKLPSNEISFYLSENKTLLITSGESTFNIITGNTDEFPENMLIEDYKELDLNKEIIKDMVKRVSFAASDEEEKVILNGVLIDIKQEDGKLYFVAADGYRLAKDEINFKSQSSLKTIIPIKTVKEVFNILNDIEVKDFKIRVSKEKVMFLIDEIMIYSRIINGQFPDYTLLIPKEKNLSLKLLRKDFYDACERVNIIAQKNSHMVKIEIIKNDLVISAVTPDFGDGSEKIKIEKSGDDTISIVFNVKLILDVLKNLDTDYIVIDIINDEKPITIKEENNNHYLYIMMPIKVKR